MLTDFTIEARPITVQEYQELRSSTGWPMLPDNVVNQALTNDLFSVCAMQGPKWIGIGRVIGDGFIYFYIQDVIVLPEFRGCGIGTGIMQNIEFFLKANTAINSFIGLMAAEGVEEFYLRFGYTRRPNRGAGMYKIIQK